MDIKLIKEEGLVLLDCISGSQAYGLNTPQSDVDKRGVFHLSKPMFYGMGEQSQVSNESNDESYSELGRFVELLSKSNPTMIELLHTPKESVLTKHSRFDQLDPSWYLTKKCKDTFAGYAVTQIRKARGLNKKIMNPMSKERKSVLDFCYVAYDQGSISLKEYLKNKGLNEAFCGLVKIPNMQEVYGLYYSEDSGYKGIANKSAATEVSLSSVPKEEKALAFMTFNASGYSSNCKEYKEYWKWVEKRNDERYQNTLAHGKNYDAKNMMHTFRLLAMAEEIATKGEVIVRRPDREFLLQVRSGVYEYEDLLLMAEDKIASMNEAYAACTLPDACNVSKLNEFLISFREDIYK